AVECAFVAAGLLRVSRFRNPNIWDVAAGTVLVAAAGGAVCYNGGDGWQDFDRFTVPPDREGGLRRWRASLMVGERSAIDLLSALHPNG
ncbi:MAG: inositol monophosphatase family protein, partial [Bauldia sp.]